MWQNLQQFQLGRPPLKERFSERLGASICEKTESFGRAGFRSLRGDSKKSQPFFGIRYFELTFVGSRLSPTTGRIC